MSGWVQQPSFGYLVHNWKNLEEEGKGSMGFSIFLFSAGKGLPMNEM